MTIKVQGMDKVEAWEAGSGPLLPVGLHHVRIDEAEAGESSNGNPQIELRFTSEAGAGSIRDWLVVVPATYPKVKQLLDAVLIESQGGDWEFDESVLVGRKLCIQVADELDFQGRLNDDGTPMTRRRVVGYLPYETEGVPGDPADLAPRQEAGGDSEGEYPF